MCFLHAKSSEISKNADIFCIFCKLKCDTIKLIAKEYFFLFCVILMTSHFSGLKAISHSLSQDSRKLRSDCRA